MEPDDIYKKLGDIESRLDKIEKKKRDFWDIFNSLATILIPATIALAGYIISNGIKKAEINVAETNAKVAQAELVNKFMTSLTSKSTLERSIAVDAIVLAIPGYGASLARSVANNDTSTLVKQAAHISLNNRMEQLVRNLFSDQATERKNAAQELMKGWQSDPLLIDHLITFAKDNQSNENGIYNSIVILNAIDKPLLIRYKDSVNKFLSVAELNGPKTKEIANKVRESLNQ